MLASSQHKAAPTRTAWLSRPAGAVVAEQPCAERRRVEEGPIHPWQPLPVPRPAPPRHLGALLAGVSLCCRSSTPSPTPRSSSRTRLPAMCWPTTPWSSAAASSACNRCWARPVPKYSRHSSAPGYTEQDRRVLKEGRGVLEDQLELHLYGSREPWLVPDPSARCTTRRARSSVWLAFPGRPAISRRQPPRLSAAGRLVRAYSPAFHQPISMGELTRIAGISVAQLERYCKRVFHLTPRQMIHKARLNTPTACCIRTCPSRTWRCAAATPTTAPSAASSSN